MNPNPLQQPEDLRTRPKNIREMLGQLNQLLDEVNALAVQEGQIEKLNEELLKIIIENDPQAIRKFLKQRSLLDSMARWLAISREKMIAIGNCVREIKTELSILTKKTGLVKWDTDLGIVTYGRNFQHLNLRVAHRDLHNKTDFFIYQCSLFLLIVSGHGIQVDPNIKRAISSVIHRRRRNGGSGFNMDDLVNLSNTATLLQDEFLVLRSSLPGKSEGYYDPYVDIVMGEADKELLFSLQRDDRYYAITNTKYLTCIRQSIETLLKDYVKCIQQEKPVSRRYLEFVFKRLFDFPETLKLMPSLKDFLITFLTDNRSEANDMQYITELVSSLLQVTWGVHQGAKKEVDIDALAASIGEVAVPVEERNKNKKSKASRRGRRKKHKAKSTPKTAMGSGTNKGELTRAALSEPVELVKKNPQAEVIFTEGKKRGKKKKRRGKNRGESTLTSQRQLASSEAKQTTPPLSEPVKSDMEEQSGEVGDQADSNTRVTSQLVPDRSVHTSTAHSKPTGGTWQVATSSKKKIKGQTEYPVIRDSASITEPTRTQTGSSKRFEMGLSRQSSEVVPPSRPHIRGEMGPSLWSDIARPGPSREPNIEKADEKGSAQTFTETVVDDNNAFPPLFPALSDSGTPPELMTPKSRRSSSSITTFSRTSSPSDLSTFSDDRSLLDEEQGQSRRVINLSEIFDDGNSSIAKLTSEVRKFLCLFDLKRQEHLADLKGERTLTKIKQCIIKEGVNQIFFRLQLEQDVISTILTIPSLLDQFLQSVAEALLTRLGSNFDETAIRNLIGQLSESIDTQALKSKINVSYHRYKREESDSEQKNKIRAQIINNSGILAPRLVTTPRKEWCEKAKQKHNARTLEAKSLELAETLSEIHQRIDSVENCKITLHGSAAICLSHKQFFEIEPPEHKMETCDLDFACNLSRKDISKILEKLSEYYEQKGEKSFKPDSAIKKFDLTGKTSGREIEILCNPDGEEMPRDFMMTQMHLSHRNGNLEMGYNLPSGLTQAERTGVENKISADLQECTLAIYRKPGEKLIDKLKANPLIIPRAIAKLMHFPEWKLEKESEQACKEFLDEASAEELKIIADELAKCLRYHPEWHADRKLFDRLLNLGHRVRLSKKIKVAQLLELDPMVVVRFLKYSLQNSYNRSERFLAFCQRFLQKNSHNKSIKNKLKSILRQFLLKNPQYLVQQNLFIRLCESLNELGVIVLYNNKEFFAFLNELKVEALNSTPDCHSSSELNLRVLVQVVDYFVYFEGEIIPESIGKYFETYWTHHRDDSELHTEFKKVLCDLLRTKPQYLLNGNSYTRLMRILEFLGVTHRNNIQEYRIFVNGLVSEAEQMIAASRQQQQPPLRRFSQNPQALWVVPPQNVKPVMQEAAIMSTANDTGACAATNLSPAAVVNL